MIKQFVLDTNILLDYPNAMTDGLQDNKVIITSTTIAELDLKKTAGGDIGFHARESIRILDGLREKGDLTVGVELPDGGTLRVEPDGISEDNLPKGGAFKLSVPDNQIISTCVYLMRKAREEADQMIRLTGDTTVVPEQVILVTNDVAMRIAAVACGVRVQAYKNSIVEDSGYKGYTDLDVPKDIIDRIYADGSVAFGPGTPEFDTYYSDVKLLENEFVTLHAVDGKASALSVYQDGRLVHIPEQHKGWIEPKNVLQSYALWALSQPADKVPLVIISGPAGTAKTFLSLATGIDAVLGNSRGTRDRRADYLLSKGGSDSDDSYSRMILCRPLGAGYQAMGYLPGDLNEKLGPLHACFLDALTAYFKRDKKDTEDEFINNQIEDLYARGVIEACALSFIRGRSISDAYMVCDEAQNATRTLIRDVITRAGAGTKMVVCGDPDQLDVPYLDKRTNGLSYAVEAFKGSKLACVIRMSEEQAVRSPLASEALRRMKL